MVDVSGLRADLEFTCPRCKQKVELRLYGPCDSCRKDLRASQAGDKSILVAAEYEPKMNVAPNAVATKD